MITGQCWCGHCRYAVAGETSTDVAICHCDTCRRTTGGTHVTWMTVPLEYFQWVGQPPAGLSTSGHGTRYFCPHCGTHLALFTTLAPTTMDITVSSLANPGDHPPNRQIWVCSRLPWLESGKLPEDPREAGVTD